LERSRTSLSKFASVTSMTMTPRVGETAAVLMIDDSGGDRRGSPPIVLLHGLTATRHYVVMGSRVLERDGHRVIAYDARGHGASDPADRYDYPSLAGDLLAVLDELAIERALIAGASMGAHTAARFAIEHPERVAGLVAMTPAFLPGREPDLARWDTLAAGLRAGGVDGFIAAYGDPDVPTGWRDTIVTVLRQRMERHEHPGAVADALEQVPRSEPFASEDELASIEAPAIVVADRDDVDPGHPLRVGERWAELLDSELLVEEPGRSPLAWQGGRVSRVIATLAERVRI
jgi:pimeloyl-ACP methyl ester carboxylesterase